MRVRLSPTQIHCSTAAGGEQGGARTRKKPRRFREGIQLNRYNPSFVKPPSECHMNSTQ
jgi:hypothetical protein